MRRPLADGRGGVALLVTLMMVSVLTMMVVGLAGVMRNEQAAARNLTYQVLAEQVAEIGVAEAMAAVLSNSPTGPNPGFTATGPGWAFQNQPPAAFLFSTNTNAGVKNLEMFGTNSMILSLPATAPRVDGFVAGGWVPLFRPNETNAFARYAWWVDDEASKLNLNLTGSNDPSLAALSTRTPFATNWVFVNPGNGQAFTPFTNQLAFRTNVFWSTESVKDLGVYGGANTNMPLTAAQYRQIKGNITAWSAVRDDLTPWGSAKFNLQDLNNQTLYPTVASAVTPLKAALMTNPWTNFFGSGMNLGRKYGGGLVASTNANNHGDLAMEQIAKNIMAAQGRPFVCTNFGGRRDFLAANHPNRHRNGLPREIASHYMGPYLEEVRVRVDGTIGGGASITGRLGILVQVVNPYNQTFSNFTLVVQPRKFRFQTIPSPGQVGLGPANIINQTSLAPLNGFVGPRDFQSDPNSGPGWYIGPEWFGNSIDPWPTNNTFTAVINSIGPKTRLSFPFEQRISFALGDNKRAQGLGSAYVILDSVKLCRGLNNFTDVIDWVSLDDFSQPGNYENSRSGALSDIGQMNLSVSTEASLVDLNAATFGGLGGRVLGLRRVDPQARFSVPFWRPNEILNGRGLFKENGGWPDSLQAWTRNGNLPVGSLVTNTGIPYLTADAAPNLLDITNHPHFVSGFYMTNGLTSIAQLGAIHTGIPWRTLRLQPTPALELAQGPPDWTLLEVFTLSGSSGARPMFNVNSAMLGMVRSGNQWTQGLVTNSLGQIQARPWAFLGAMGPVGTNLSTNTTIINRAISNGIPVSMTNGAILTAVLTNLAGNLTNALLAPTNPAVWSANSGWGGYRAANTNRFPSRGLLLRGEILEVRGLAEDTNAAPATGEDLLEGRQRLFLDMMTTRSDTFSVWSVGQGLSVFTNARGRIQTNVMGEVRQQTVFQRVPVQQNGVTTEYRVERLYSRTHTLEELAAEDLR